MLEKKPNIIFLDMDGVLCNPSTCIAMGDVGGVFSYIDPISAGLVKKLCVDYNCKIVISSSWRNWYDYEAMTAILNAACPTLGRYVINTYKDKWANNESWRTGDFIWDCELEKPEHTGRGMEIKKWIDEHSEHFNNFVILDDDSDMEPLLDNFVKTDCYDGMLFKHFEKAREILKREPDDLM